VPDWVADPDPLSSYGSALLPIKKEPYHYHITKSLLSLLNKTLLTLVWCHSLSSPIQVGTGTVDFFLTKVGSGSESGSVEIKIRIQIRQKCHGFSNLLKTSTGNCYNQKLR